MKLRFSGHRALILGGSCGIGSALASMMLDAGLYPIITHRNTTGEKKIKTRFEDSADQYECLRLELKDAASAVADFEQIQGDVDYLVDFAQSDFESLVVKADSSHAEQFFRINIAARTAIIKQAAQCMLRKQGGRMVFVSSVAAQRANPGQGFYAAAKRAAEALYTNLGLELARKNITTVILRPGYVNAGRGRRYLKHKPEAISHLVPLGRALTAEEVAETILFLLSDSAQGFNATVLTMDGGLAAAK